MMIQNGVIQGHRTCTNSYNHLFAVNQFELTALQAQQLQFDHKQLVDSKIDIKNRHNNPHCIDSGYNPQCSILATVVRVIRMPHCICLLTNNLDNTCNNNQNDEIKHNCSIGKANLSKSNTSKDNVQYKKTTNNLNEFSQFTMAVFVIINPSQQDECQQAQKFIPMAKIQVGQPYRRNAQEGSLPSFVASLQNVTIIQSQSNRNTGNLKNKEVSNGVSNICINVSQKYREKANTCFKAGKFIEAAHLYQQALIHLLVPNKRVRSILYSNTAACLYQLRLFNSCCLYSGLAAAIDPTYSKAYYRKINSLLQMRNLGQALPLILRIQSMVSATDFDTINERYTNYTANQSGFFAWQLLLGGTGLQGEFLSDCLQCRWIDGELRYFAKRDIPRYELLLVGKPLLYMQASGQLQVLPQLNANGEYKASSSSQIQGGRQFKDCFSQFLQQVQAYYLFDVGYQQAIHCLPCKCHPTLLERQHYYSHFKGLGCPLPRKELFNKMQRCLMQEKGIDKPEDSNGYGVWPHMFYFQNSCQPNCTALHLNRCLIVNAINYITKGTMLSLDFIADVDPNKRQQTLQVKFDKICNCPLCNINTQNIDINVQNEQETIQNPSEQTSQLEENILENEKDSFNQKNDQQHKNHENMQQKNQDQVFQVDFLKSDLILNTIYNGNQPQGSQNELVRVQKWRLWSQLSQAWGVSEEEIIQQLMWKYLQCAEKEFEWDDVLNLFRLIQDSHSTHISHHLENVIKHFLMCFLKVSENQIENFFDAVLTKYLNDEGQDSV